MLDFIDREEEGYTPHDYFLTFKEVMKSKGYKIIEEKDGGIKVVCKDCVITIDKEQKRPKKQGVNLMNVFQTYSIEKPECIA